MDPRLEYEYDDDEENQGEYMDEYDYDLEEGPPRIDRNRLDNESDASSEERYDAIIPADESIIDHFSEVIENGTTEEITAFLDNLERNFLSNKMFENDSNALIYSLSHNRFDLALALLNRETIDVNVTDATNSSALFHCVNVNYYDPLPETEAIILEIVEKLLAAGCNPGHIDNDGYTALSYACKYATPINVKIISLLLDDDRCNPTRIDEHGKTGLDWLLSFGKDYPIQQFISFPGYIELVIKYFEVFIRLKGVNDSHLIKIITNICKRNKRSKLRKIFGPKLNKKFQIDLNKYCKRPRPAIEVSLVGLAGAEYADSASLALAFPDQTEARQIQEAIVIRPEGVSPGDRWVNEEDEELYERLSPMRRYGGKKSRKNKLHMRKTRKGKRANKKSIKNKDKMNKMKGKTRRST
jgi:hypothetical protein